MKKLPDRRALLFAFITSIVSLLATLGTALFFENLSGKQLRLTESGSVSGETMLRGRQIFVEHCVECHGFDPRGAEGSDLHNLRAGDVLIRQVITGGIKGEMPAYGKVLNKADVLALTSYLRTLRN